ncbi:MAG: DUF4399 domain-containing protein, partial [Immundisolibacteraceae bacterium]|nr:DUF4399 domain-containing protein [Immundisolibacteraceae bacterium]
MNRKQITWLALIGVLFATATAQAEPELYFISPHSGQVLSSPVTVKFGLSGFGVAPAGIDKANTGHHHLLIDTGLPVMDL